MIKPQFIFTGLVLVFSLCIAGFSGLYTPTSTHKDVVGQRFLSVPPDVLSPMQFLITSVPVCVRRGGASRRERKEFADCIAKTECENWKRYEDERNGNVAMICQD